MFSLLFILPNTYLQRGFPSMAVYDGLGSPVEVAWPVIISIILLYYSVRWPYKLPDFLLCNIPNCWVTCTHFGTDIFLRSYSSCGSLNCIEFLWMFLNIWWLLSKTEVYWNLKWICVPNIGSTRNIFGERLICIYSIVVGTGYTVNVLLWCAICIALLNMTFLECAHPLCILKVSVQGSNLGLESWLLAILPEMWFLSVLPDGCRDRTIICLFMSWSLLENAAKVKGVWMKSQF